MRSSMLNNLALATAVALGVSAVAQAQQAAPAAPAPRVLKMQSTWPASSSLQENFKLFAERVDKMTGGALKIETMAGGQVVPAFEVLDATNKKVIDGAHAVTCQYRRRAGKKYRRRPSPQSLRPSAGRVRVRRV